MTNSSNAVTLVKKAAVEAVEAAKPVHLLFGTVVSISPLRIQTDQKTTYTERMLVLTQRVTDHRMEEYSAGQMVTRHIHAALAVGDRVLLIRIQGGRKFVVLDRIGGTG